MNDGDTSYRDIGRRLVHLRQSLGYNQASFIRLVDIGQTTFSNYENGLRRPEFEEALKIVARTGVTLDWIYAGIRTGLPAHLMAVLPPLPPPQSDQSQVG